MQAGGGAAVGLAAFRRAVEAADADALVACLADDVVFRSPAVHEPYTGRAAAGAVLRAVVEVFEDFRYLDELHGEGTVALIFSARVGRYDIEGLDLLRFADDGAVAELTVMIRPFRGLQATLEAVGTRLAEAAG